MAASGIAADAASWLKEAEEGTVRVLAARGVGDRRGTGPGRAAAAGADHRCDETKAYGGAVNLTTRLLTLLSAEGLIVRGRPRGGWTSTQFTWSAAPERTDLPAAAARAELARRWLAAFGPAPLSDLQWWTGWTRGQVRQAVSSLDLAEVDLGGTPGVLLAGDEPGPRPAEPWAALLPALDPTAMGWRERAWYVGEHARGVVRPVREHRPDRLVGRPDRGRLGAAPGRRDRGPAARGRRRRGRGGDGRRGRRLGEWIGPGARVTPRFRTPLERELAGR